MATVEEMLSILDKWELMFAENKAERKHVSNENWNMWIDYFNQFENKILATHNVDELEAVLTSVRQPSSRTSYGAKYSVKETPASSYARKMLTRVNNVENVPQVSSERIIAPKKGLLAFLRG